MVSSTSVPTVRALRGPVNRQFSYRQKMGTCLSVMFGGVGLELLAYPIYALTGIARVGRWRGNIKHNEGYFGGGQMHREFAKFPRVVRGYILCTVRGANAAKLQHAIKHARSNKTKSLDPSHDAKQKVTPIIPHHEEDASEHLRSNLIKNDAHHPNKDALYTLTNKCLFPATFSLGPTVLYFLQSL